MSQVKVMAMKLGNALKVGRTEIVFANDEFYDVTLYDNNRVQVVEKKTGAETWTTLANVVGWTQEKPVAKPSENEDVHIDSEPSMVEDRFQIPSMQDLKKEEEIEPQPEPLKPTHRRGVKKKTSSQSR